MEISLLQRQSLCWNGSPGSHCLKWQRGCISQSFIMRSCYRSIHAYYSWAFRSPYNTVNHDTQLYTIANGRIYRSDNELKKDNALLDVMGCLLCLYIGENWPYFVMGYWDPIFSLKYSMCIMVDDKEKHTHTYIYKRGNHCAFKIA